MNYKTITGGVTAPLGFLASGIHCGLKKRKEKKDLALIYSEVPCIGAGVYTQNVVKGAPIYITKKHLLNPNARAIICNSGNANTCTGDDGLEKAERMTYLQAMALNISPDEVLVSSTGVIGAPLNIESIEKAIPHLTESLSKDGSNNAASAILTTDKFTKEYSLEFIICGHTVKMGAIAKGSGMVHPNMGTILSFITTDISISPLLLAEALNTTTKVSYNRISVDGDTSTSDMVLILANGMANNPIISEKNDDYFTFLKVLEALNIYLSKSIARDGDGATKLIECTVIGAKTEEDGEILAKSVITSNLVKTALFGSDANWGRILSSLGSTSIDFDLTLINIYLENYTDSIQVCRNGAYLPFDEILAKRILQEEDILIKVVLSSGDITVSAWGCDLNYEYIRVTGDYRNLKGGY